jgi:hypothetical protein
MGCKTKAQARCLLDCFIRTRDFEPNQVDLPGHFPFAYFREYSQQIVEAGSMVIVDGAPGGGNLLPVKDYNFSGAAIALYAVDEYHPAAAFQIWQQIQTAHASLNQLDICRQGVLPLQPFVNIQPRTVMLNEPVADTDDASSHRQNPIRNVP